MPNKWVPPHKLSSHDAPSYNAIINATIKKYGPKSQMVKAMEELSELQVELAKSINGNHRRDRIIEEIADVSIMITQLKRIIGDEAIDRVIEQKMRALELHHRDMDGFSDVPLYDLR